MILLILILSIVAFIAYLNGDKYLKEAVPIGYSASLFVIFYIWFFPYYSYVSNKAIVYHYEESIKIKNEELNDTIKIQKEGSIFQNKFSQYAIASANHDKPIESTNQYLKEIQKERLKERNDYIKAKKAIYSYENGFFGWFLF